MARLRLSRLHDWALADPRQDLRGREVLDASGGHVGTIADLIVNTLTDEVDGILLDTGASYRLRDLQREGSAVRLRTEAGLHEAEAKR